MPYLRLKRAVVGLGVACALTLSTGAQTRIVAPKNSYSPADDVKLGREAAAEVGKELPMLNDQRLEDYAETIGRTLATASPPEFQHQEVRCTGAGRPGSAAAWLLGGVMGVSRRARPRWSPGKGHRSTACADDQYEWRVSAEEWRPL